MQKFCTICGTKLVEGQCPSCEPHYFEENAANIPADSLERTISSSLPRKGKKKFYFAISAIAAIAVIFFLAGGASWVSGLTGGQDKENAEAEAKKTSPAVSSTQTISLSQSKLEDPLKAKAIWTDGQDDNGDSKIEVTLTNQDKNSLRLSRSNFHSIDSNDEEIALVTSNQGDEIIIAAGEKAKLTFTTHDIYEETPRPKTLVYDEPNGIRLKWDFDNYKAYHDDWIKTQLNYFITTFSEASVDAINKRDFYLVADLINDNDKRYEEVREYIDHLESKGIYEKHIRTNVENVKSVDPYTWEVTLTETFIIYKPGEENERTFRSTCIVHNIDGEYKMGTLTETKEI